MSIEAIKRYINTRDNWDDCIKALESVKSKQIAKLKPDPRRNEKREKYLERHISWMRISQIKQNQIHAKEMNKLRVQNELLSNQAHLLLSQAGVATIHARQKLLHTRFSLKFIKENNLNAIRSIEEAYLISECNETQAIVYSQIRSSGYTSTGHFGKLFNLSRTAIHDTLKQLKEKGLIVMQKEGRKLIVKTVYT